jgi:hypothetical protein
VCDGSGVIDDGLDEKVRGERQEMIMQYRLGIKKSERQLELFNDIA